LNKYASIRNWWVMHLSWQQDIGLSTQYLNHRSFSTSISNFFLSLGIWRGRGLLRSSVRLMHISFRFNSSTSPVPVILFFHNISTISEFWILSLEGMHLLLHKNIIKLSTRLFASVLLLPFCIPSQTWIISMSLSYCS